MRVSLQADLFPTPDQPVCGTCIDPITMPWSAGKLDQVCVCVMRGPQWDAGLIGCTFAVLECSNGHSLPSPARYLFLHCKIWIHPQ